MQGSRLVRRHQRGGARPQNPDTAESSAVADHLEKAGVVPCRGRQTRAAGKAPAWPIHVVPLPLRSFLRADDLALRSACIDRGEPFSFGGRDEESRVFHPEWAGDAGADELIEGLARGLLDNTAQNIGVVAIHERLARLGNEGESAEPLHGFADGFVLVGGVPAAAGGRTKALGFIQCGNVRLAAIGNARRVGEQVGNGDRPFGGNDSGAAILILQGNRRLLESRDKISGGLLDADLAFLDQRHHRRAGDRLGLRGDPEQRVHGHLAARFLVAPPESLLVGGLAVSKNQRHGAGHAILIDVLPDDAIDAGQPVGSERRRR
ncbi:MAG: hypothetical protein IANPNBLG_04836 [Bryobacteraceae bacterium]|nr:hypothetical protein [Bryobacteraceae bacterium]